MAEEKRDSALLTPRQREVLRGEADISARGIRSARTRIKERIKNGLLDFRIIFDNLTEEDRDALLDEDPHDRAMVHDGMVAAAALFYEIHDREGWPFSELLERAVEDAYEHNERSPSWMIVEDVEFDVSLNPPREREQIERSALQKFTRGDELTDREYRILTEPKGWIIDPDSGLYLAREDILETLQERRGDRGRERHREKMMDRVETDADMFGKGYQVPPDLREEMADELEDSSE